MSKIFSILILITFLSGNLSAQMATIPGGTFSMGSDQGETDERPSSTVSLSSFMMMSHEVTRAQYDECVRASRCSQPHYEDGQCVIWSKSGFKNVRVPREFQNPDYPVVCVTYQQARQYCSWKQMELPTEAQWEYAARSGQNNRYSWGNSVPGSAQCSMSPDRHPREVGSFKSSTWGLYDMTGNVWEWTNDFYDQNRYQEHAGSHNPGGPEAGFYRVIRGGGWYSGAANLRTTNRHWFSPNFAEASLGFRCVKNSR